MFTQKYCVLYFVFILMWVMLSFGQMVFAQDDGPHTIMTEDGERGFYIHFPQDYDPEVAAPLVILLHGAGGSGLEFMLTSDANTAGDEAGALLVYPNGIQKGWNYLDRDQLHPDDLYTNDVGFVETIIDEMSENYLVDEDRIYAVGYSNGGYLAFRLRCELSDRLAGIVTIGATLSYDVAEHCKRTNPVSVMMVQGTEDNWDGYAILTEDRRIRNQFSVTQTLTFLTSLIQCEEDPIIELVSSPESQIPVVSQRYENCRNETAFQLYGIVDAGHAFPTHLEVTLSDGEIGGIGDMMFDFMMAHPRQ